MKKLDLGLDVLLWFACVGIWIIKSYEWISAVFEGNDPSEPALFATLFYIASRYLGQRIKAAQNEVG